MAKNDCPYTPGINCPEKDRRCPMCGWSPEGAKRRRDLAQLKATVVPTAPSAPRKPPRGRIVAKVNESGRVLEVYPSIVEAAQANNMSSQTVKNYLREKVKHPFKCTGGYTFCYAD